MNEFGCLINILQEDIILNKYSFVSLGLFMQSETEIVMSKNSSLQFLYKLKIN